jgi:hypothetical protein
MKPDKAKKSLQGVFHGAGQIAAESSPWKLHRERQDFTRDVDRAEQGVLFEDDVDNLAAGFIAAIASHRFQHRGPDKIMA